MAIKIIDEKQDVHITRKDHDKYLHDYQQAYMYHSGPVPSFEEYVRSRLINNVEHFDALCKSINNKGM